MEGLRPGRFSDVDHFAVIVFYGSGNAFVSGEFLTDRGPTVCDPLFSQFETDGVQYMVSQNGDEEMTIPPMFILMINRA